MGQVDKLGEWFDARPAERPQPVDRPIARVGYAPVWPPEVLAEIRRIYSGEEE